MSLAIIPNIDDNLTAGEKKVINKIMAIYDNVERKCYVYVQPRLRNLEPDFIIIDPLKGVSIIEVKDWSKDYIESINPKQVITVDGKTFHNPIRRANQYYSLVQGLFESEEELLCQEGGKLNFNVYSRVIFTNMTSGETESISKVLLQLPAQYITSEKLKKLSEGDMFGVNSCNLSPEQILIIRSILFPEIRIVTAQKGVGITSQNVDKVIKALDDEQESFAKRVPYGHYIVSGVPGSGKTVMLLARALFLAKENPDWKIRIVTYNGFLAKKMENRIECMSNELNFMGIDHTNISITTFHKLALEVSGLAVPQNPPEDWWRYELPQKAFEKAKGQFDAMLIDEYQDFYDVWIKLCLALCKKHVHRDEEIENIFMAGDRLQSIYNPREHTWKSLGINVVGKAKLLKHAYRSGKKHIEKALDFLMTDPQLAREVESFYEGRDGIDNDTNITSDIEFLEGNFKTVSSLLHDLIFKVGYKPEDIMMLVPTFKEAGALYYSLDSSLRSKVKVTKDSVDDKAVITTYHSSKGLEAKICILVNTSRFPNGFASGLEAKKLLYVGMTRASEKLYIHATHYNGESFAKDLKNA